jgi:hypothetical protein
VTSTEPPESELAPDWTALVGPVGLVVVGVALQIAIVVAAGCRGMSLAQAVGGVALASGLGGGASAALGWQSNLVVPVRWSWPWWLAGAVAAVPEAVVLARAVALVIGDASRAAEIGLARDRVDLLFWLLITYAAIPVAGAALVWGRAAGAPSRKVSRRRSSERRRSGEPARRATSPSTTD